MSDWASRISDHAIWGELKALGSSIDEALKVEGNNSDAISGIERIRSIITFCGKRLASADPMLIDVRELNNISNHIYQARSDIDSYISDPNLFLIIQANSKLDETLKSIGSLPSVINIEELNQLSANATSYRKSVERLLKALELSINASIAQSHENHEAINGIASTISSEQQRLAALTSDFQTQFATSQDRRSTDFNEQLNSQQTKFTSAFSELNTTFSTDQDSRKSEFSELTRDWSAEFQQMLEKHNAALAEQKQLSRDKLSEAQEAHKSSLSELDVEYKQEASNILREVTNHRESVEKLVGVIGNLGVTSGYLKVANHARIMLYIWQCITVLALAGLICIAVIMVKQHSATPATTPTTPLTNAGPEKNKALTSTSNEAIKATPSDLSYFKDFAARVFLSIAFGVFATYAARQAGHFRDTEQRNRKRALELEALGPFIEPLEKADKDKFRVQIGERSFAVADEPKTQKEDDPATFAAFLKSKDILEAFTNFIKAAKS